MRFWLKAGRQVAERAVACGHGDAAFGIVACTHLNGFLAGGPTYIRWYTGVDVESELLCEGCSAQRERGGGVALIGLCERCCAVLVEYGSANVPRGAPGIIERLQLTDTSLHETALPPHAQSVLDFAAIDDQSGVWIVLGRDGAIGQINTESGAWSGIGTIGLPNNPLRDDWKGTRPRPRLHVSCRWSLCGDRQ